jgi:hypothetical protein
MTTECFSPSPAEITLSPHRLGGEGRVRGADLPVRGIPQLTLPPLRGGSLPLPPEGGEGLFLATG